MPIISGGAPICPCPMGDAALFCRCVVFVRAFSLNAFALLSGLLIPHNPGLYIVRAFACRCPCNRKYTGGAYICCLFRGRDGGNGRLARRPLALCFWTMALAHSMSAQDRLRCDDTERGSASPNSFRVQAPRTLIHLLMRSRAQAFALHSHHYARAQSTAAALIFPIDIIVRLEPQCQLLLQA